MCRIILFCFLAKQDKEEVDHSSIRGEVPPPLQADLAQDKKHLAYLGDLSRLLYIRNNASEEAQINQVKRFIQAYQKGNGL